MKPLLQILHIAKLSVYSLALSGVLVSCSDLLEKNPPSAISDNTFWTGENDAYLALVGCYRFQTGWSHDDFATLKDCCTLILLEATVRKKRILLL